MKYRNYRPAIMPSPFINGVIAELVVEEGEKILPAVAKGPCDTAQLPRYVTTQYLTLKHALSCEFLLHLFVKVVSH